MDMKYAKLVANAHETNVPLLHRFTPEIAEKIIELSDESKTRKYTHKEWIELAEECEKKNIFELKLAALKARGIPQAYQERIMKSMFGIEKAYILASQDITGHTIEELSNIIGKSTMQNFILNIPEALSQESLYLLCYKISDIKDEVWHSAYAKITKENPAYDFLEEILENQDGTYDSQIDDEEFLFAIATNANLSNEIRNKAFDIAACDEAVANPTPYIAKIKYEQIASTMFDIDKMNIPASDKMTLQAQANEKLKSMIFAKELPVVCQLDYIERYKVDKYNGRKYIIEFLTKHTESPRVLSSILEMDFNFKKNVSDNRTAIDSDVMDTYLRFAHKDFLTRVYIRHLFQNPTRCDLAKTMLSAEKSGLATRIAFLTSNKQKEITNYHFEDIKQDVKGKEKELLHFLDRLKNLMKSYDGSEKILCKVAYNLYSQTNEYKHRDPMSAASQLITEFNTVINKKECHPMKKSTYMNIKICLFEIEQEFKEQEYQDEIQKIKKEIKEIYNNSKIVIDFPALFRPNEVKNQMINEDMDLLSKCPIPNNIPFSHLNLNALLGMSQERIKEFKIKLDEINNLEIKKIICSGIEEALKKIPTHDAEKRFILIHKFTDIYNELIEDIEKERLSNKETEVSR